MIALRFVMIQTKENGRSPKETAIAEVLALPLIYVKADGD